MGFLDGVTDFLGITNKQGESNLNAYQQQMAAERQRAKEQQYSLLGQMRGPSLTPQMQARIKALEEESKLGLRQDPQFQSQVRQATVGGAQALGAIQNKQAATGTTGGFSNVGSMNDVYDRLGVQLAELAQNQNQYANQKRDTAAELQQGFADAQMQYNNSIVAAKQAIEAGDSAAAQQAMSAAYAAQEQMRNANRQALAGYAGLGITALTGLPAGGSMMGLGGQQQAAPAQAGGSYAPVQNIAMNNQRNPYQPYYQMRG